MKMMQRPQFVMPIQNFEPLLQSDLVAWILSSCGGEEFHYPDGTTITMNADFLKSRDVARVTLGLITFCIKNMADFKTAVAEIRTILRDFKDLAAICPELCTYISIIAQAALARGLPEDQVAEALYVVVDDEKMYSQLKAKSIRTVGEILAFFENFGKFVIDFSNTTGATQRLKDRSPYRDIEWTRGLYSAHDATSKQPYPNQRGGKGAGGGGHAGGEGGPRNEGSNDNNNHRDYARSRNPNQGKGNGKRPHTSQAAGSNEASAAASAPRKPRKHCAYCAFAKREKAMNSHDTHECHNAELKAAYEKAQNEGANKKARVDSYSAIAFESREGGEREESTLAHAKLTPSLKSHSHKERKAHARESKRTHTSKQAPSQADQSKQDERTEEAQEKTRGKERLHVPTSQHENERIGDCIEEETVPFSSGLESLCAARDTSLRAIAITLQSTPQLAVLDTQASKSIIDASLVPALVKRGAQRKTLAQPIHFSLAANFETAVCTEVVVCEVEIDTVGETKKKFKDCFYVLPDLFTTVVIGERTCIRAKLLTYTHGLPWMAEETSDDEPVAVVVEEMIETKLFSEDQIPQVAKTLALRQEFCSLLNNAAQIMSDEKMPPASKAPPHKIPTNGKSMKKTKIRSFRADKLAAAKEQVALLVEHGLAVKLEDQPVSHVAQVVMLPKKGGDPKVKEWRMAVDYRPTLNVVAADIAGFVPNIPQLVRDAGGYKYYAQLDLKSAYWQILLDKESIPLTAFMVDGTIYGFTRLPIGYSQAASVFNNYTDMCFRDILGKTEMSAIFKYFDNILIGANTEEELLKATKKVLDVCLRYNLTLSPSKTEIGVDSTIFLGYKVSQQGHEIDPARLEALLAIRAPKTRKQLRAILGTFNYVRDYIANYSHYAKALSPLTVENGQKFEWTQENQRDLQALQEAAARSKALAPFDPSKPVIIHTDASKRAVGAVMLQPTNDKDIDHLQAVAFSSKAFTDQQQRWPNWERELFAVYHALQHWHGMIGHIPVVIRTDCQSIRNLNMSRVSDKVARWLSYIWQQPHTMQYIQGELNLAADCMSRMVTPAPRTSTSKREEALGQDNAAPMEAVVLAGVEQDSSTHEAQRVSDKDTSTEWPQLEDNDADDPAWLEDDAPPEVQEIIASIRIEYNTRSKNREKVAESTPPPPQTAPSEEKEKPNRRKKQRRDQELLKEKEKEPSKHISEEEEEEEREEAPKLTLSAPEIATKLQLPEQHVRWVLDVHGSEEHGHWGEHKTELLLKEQQKTWKGMKRDIKAIISACALCQKHKVQNRKQATIPIGNLAARVPNESWSIDFAFVEGTKVCKHGHIGWLNVIDDHSRYVRGCPITRATGEEAIKHLSALFAQSTQPLQIRFDSGAQFKGELFTNFLNSKGIRPHCTTPHRHEANGIAERVTQTLKTQIAICIAAKGESTPWCEALTEAMTKYNRCPHSATQASPQSIMFPPPKQSLVLLAEREIERIRGDETALAVNAARAEQVNKVQKTILGKRKEKEATDSVTTFKVGDLVLREYEQRPSKLSPRYAGPFRVIAADYGQHKYTLEDARGGARPVEAHITQLFAFNDSCTPDITVVASTDDGKWIPEKILQHSTDDVVGENGKKIRATDLLVKWRGFDRPTWTATGTINPSNCQALALYLQEKKLFWRSGCVEKRAK